MRTGDPFAQPGSIRQIAKELVVSDAAVKFHLANLYDKFALYDHSENRRVQLANEAIRRRAVTIADLAPPASGA
jgi:DNA-binding NarL/FixJ family response regulator